MTAVALVAGPVEAGASPPSRPDLQGMADAIVAAGAPGVEVSVRDEFGDWSGVSGVGDLRTGAAPDAGGPVRIGSLTKSFTATMVMQLVAEGEIALDAPVDDYLPGLLPYEEDVTVRQLLQHRSGLYDYKEALWPDARAAYESRFETYAPAELVGIATEFPLTSGDEFAYSNTGYTVLGMLIEKVTGHRVATELRHRILEPAGLRETYLPGAWPFLPRPAMRGYEELDGRLTDFTTFNMTSSWTSGGLVSTSDDVNRFYAALLGGGLLPAEQLAQMQQTVPAFPGFGYGLGLAGGEFCGQQVWGHVGGAPGYLSYSFTGADLGRQITITVNRSLTGTEAVAEAIVGMVRTEFCAA